MIFSKSRYRHCVSLPSQVFFIVGAPLLYLLVLYLDHKRIAHSGCATGIMDCRCWNDISYVNVSKLADGPALQQQCYLTALTLT